MPPVTLALVPTATLHLDALDKVPIAIPSVAAVPSGIAAMAFPAPIRVTEASKEVFRIVEIDKRLS